MAHNCDACGEEFGTLSRKRLHDCPDGARYGSTDAPDEDIPVDGMDPDDMTNLAVERLLICDVCGEGNDEANSVDTSQDGDRLGVAVLFECSECGAWNENSGVLE